MKPRRSEIFEAYEQIAQEKGWIKSAETLEQYKKEVYPRAGSDTVEKIEKLYNTKPESPFKYEHNIMEVAHPNSVIIAPSYDKLNGLVENDIERQKIDINLVMKPTDGITDYRKYAQKNLLLALVRLANDLDNQGNEELRQLTDDCITSLALAEKKSPEIDG